MIPSRIYGKSLFRRKITFILLFFIVYATSSGQLLHLKFEHIGVKEGLSNSKVRGILQDRYGFMWFATQDGLNRYDGYGFTVYKNNPDDPGSLSHNGLREIIEDSRGNIWIATWGGGVNVFNQNTQQFTRFTHDKNDSHSISDDFVFCLLEDHEGTIWIGTDKGGLNRYDPQTKGFTSFTHDKNNPHSIGDNQVRDIFEDKQHNLWIATEFGGLNLFDRKNNTFRRFVHNPSDSRSIGSNSIRSVIEDKNGNLWVGTYGEGLDLFIRSREEFVHFNKDPKNENSLVHNAVQYLRADRDGNLWIGTENGGISVLDPINRNFYNYAHDDIDKESISDNSIYAIIEDIQGNIWIGTYNDGVNLVNKDHKFIHYRRSSSPHSLSNNLVACMAEDSKGNLLIGTDGGGLNKLDKKTGRFIHYSHEEGNTNTICGNHVLSTMEDSDGNIWVGTWGRGVTKFNPEKNIYEHFRHDPSNGASLSSNNVWKVFEDREGNIWIGTYGGGLNLYNKHNDTFTHLGTDPNDPESISTNTIYTITEDRTGNLWIGTDGGGMNRLDKKTGQFKRYMHDPVRNSLSHNRVVCIREDRKGNLWIGTSQGLNFFDVHKNQFTVYEEKDGLPSDAILGILEDNAGNLWISTNKGVSKFELERKKFINFTTADGLQSGDQSFAHCKSRTGAMYFGGKGGFNEFFPDKIILKSFDPPLVLTGFEIFNRPIQVSEKPGSLLSRPISQTKEIVLSHKHSVFSIRFASLNYTKPENKQYSYILEGFNEDWNSMSPAYVATYTNLNPGRYTFRVRALDNDGNWSKNSASLQIIITPPYWKTWWFRTSAIIVVMSIVLAVYTRRINSIKEQKKELQKLVDERTGELKNKSDELEVLYTEVKDSIRAAQVIQNSILPTNELMKKYFPQSFILNKPKDVVSGDFYWFDEKEGQIIIAAADCTGHGVSGAFMSINGYHLLNKAVYNNRELVASGILDRLNADIIEDLHSDEHMNGMDIGLCIVNPQSMIMQYAGAVSPLYLVRNRELMQIKGDPFTIGLVIKGQVKQFTNHQLSIQKGDMIYMFSDGFPDQIGGVEENKFSYQKFRELLVSISEDPADIQLQKLENEFVQWLGSNEQLDDILVIGFKIV